MLFDTLDGFFARIFKAAGRFGAELDSLCDAISFGVAPAFILLQVGPDRVNHPLLHMVLAGVATLYMMCTILRLARFNVESVEGSKKFKGLPSPAAAGCIASLSLVSGTLPDNRWPTVSEILTDNVLEAWATGGAIFVAILMVSNVTYPHLTKQIMRKKSQPLVILLPLLMASILLRELTLVLAFWSYAVFFSAKAVWLRITHHSKGQDPISRRV